MSRAREGTALGNQALVRCTGNRRTTGKSDDVEFGYLIMEKIADKDYYKIKEEIGMTQEEEYAQYKEALLTLINSINREIPLEESNQVLMVYKLNTPDKIRKFCKKLKSRLQDGTLKMTEAEIVRAAVQASKTSPQ